jgi:hypothetical protein
MLLAVNYLAVLVAAVAGMAVGYVWYGALFGKAWTKLTGKTMDSKDGAGMAYGITFVATLVMAYFLAEVLKWVGVIDLTTGLMYAVVVWVGFVATSGLINATFVGKPRNLYLLEQGHHLLVLLVQAAILTLWV